jgi:enolase-phosphatase E1
VITFSGKVILLDIEGTTSSIRFVYDVMFPFARRELAAYVQEHWNQPQLTEACELIARDTGAESFSHWQATAGVPSDSSEPADIQAAVTQHVQELMDQDIKATGLKTLQGLIWKSGFESGEMEAHVYPDVPPTLQKWKQAGLDLRIYSSGSIAAQKLFFGHSLAGNMLQFFSEHYDTTIGSKKEADSYQRITSDIQAAPDEILFLSDVPAELDAAASAGLHTALCQRPENPIHEDPSQHAAFSTFDQVQATLTSS